MAQSNRICFFHCVSCGKFYESEMRPSFSTKGAVQSAAAFPSP
ncbi:hypothetical protein VU00_10516, partial [Candidatus Electrothrix marina]